MNGFHMLMPEEYRALISLVPHEHGAPAADEEECSRLCDELLDFLLQEKVLLVQGTAFNWPWPDHFRIVTLPRVDDIELSLSKFARFLSGYHQL